MFRWLSFAKSFDDRPTERQAHCLKYDPLHWTSRVRSTTTTKLWCLICQNKAISFLKDYYEDYCANQDDDYDDEEKEEDLVKAFCPKVSVRQYNLCPDTCPVCQQHLVIRARPSSFGDNLEYCGDSDTIWQHNMISIILCQGLSMFLSQYLIFIQYRKTLEFQKQSIYSQNEGEGVNVVRDSLKNHPIYLP